MKPTLSHSHQIQVRRVLSRLHGDVLARHPGPQRVQARELAQRACAGDPMNAPAVLAPPRARHATLRTCWQVASESVWSGK